MAKEHVYLAPGANIESTDTFASWINTTNLLINDMGTVVLTSVNQPIPNTSVGGITTGNSHIEGIFGANTFAAGTALRGGSVNATANLNITSNTIFANSNIVTVGSNTNIFTVNANNSVFTSNVAINNAAKVFTITAANTQFNAGTVHLKANTIHTGTRFDLDGTDFDVTANTVINAAVLNANAATTTVGLTGGQVLDVNSRSTFNANVTVNGIFTSTANALFTGAQAQFDNNVILGSSVADSLSVNAYLITDLLPTDTTVDLGTDAKPFGNVHTTEVFADNNVDALGEVIIRGAASRVIKSKSTNTSYQDFIVKLETSTGANTNPLVANSTSIAGGANTTFDLGSTTNNWRFGYLKDLAVANSVVIAVDAAINGSNLTTTNSTFNLINTTPTTVNFAGAATTLVAGANTGTMTLRNPIIVGANTTQALFNTVATTVNFAGAATSLVMGAATGTTNIRNNADIDGTLNVDGAAITTSAATVGIADSTTTTLNIGGAATAVTLGAATGTLTLRNPTIVGTGAVANLFNTTATTVNFAGAATTLNVANAAGAQTVTIGGSSTAASTYNLGTGVTATATTKALNIGTGGAAGSTTNINIGTGSTLANIGIGSTTASGVTTLNSPTIVGGNATQALFNTVATTLNFGGAATAINMGAATGTLTLNNPTIVGSNATQALFNTVATTLNFAGAATTLNIGTTAATAQAIGIGSASANNIVTFNGGGATGTITLTSNITTGNFNIASSVTSGNTNIGSANTAGKVKILHGTAASNTTTGALIVEGGVGIKGNEYIGGALVVTGTTNLQGNVTVDGTFTLTSGNVEISSNTGLFNTVTVYDTFTIDTGFVASELVPSANNTYDLGTTNNRWRALHANSGAFTALSATDITANTVHASNGLKDGVRLISGPNGTIGRFISIQPPATLSSNTTLTLADGATTLQAGTMAITGGKLNQFASTTSAELAGVISDGTGTGGLVFATNAVMTLPTFGGTGVKFNGSTSGNTTLVAAAAAGTTTITMPATTGTMALTSNINDPLITFAASTGISLSATPTFTLNQAGTKTITITNSDTGSAQNIFKTIANNTGVSQFTAASNSDAIRFAASGGVSVAFDGATKTITYSMTEADTLQTVTTRGATSTDAIQLTNATESTSTSTGALRVSGGVGIVKNLFVGGNTGITGTITSGTWNGATVGVGFGGTGQTTFTNGQLLIGNTTGNTLAKATLTQGANMIITNGAGTITLAAADTNLSYSSNTTTVTISSSTGTGAVITAANSTVAGVVTTGAQTIFGAKTFDSAIVGSLTGNASTATSAATLTTARTIAITGGVTGTATSFNGSANISIPITAMDASSLTTGTVPDARISGSYTGMTNLTGSGNVDFNLSYMGLGSNTVPSYSFTGDTDTGMYSAAANQINFTTAGVERFRIDTSGAYLWRVDIGPVLRLRRNYSVGSANNDQTGFIDGEIYDTAYTALVGSRIFTTLNDNTIGATSTSLTFQNRVAGTLTTILTLSDGRLRGPNGTVALPAYSFGGDTDTGAYWVAADQFGIATGGVNRLTANATGIHATTFNGALSGNASTATSAATLTTARTIAISGGVTGTATSFNGSANITIPITAMDASSLTTGTIPDARLSGSYTGMTNLTGSGNVDFAYFLGNPADTAALPGFTWTGDVNTGLYRPADDAVGITTGGVVKLTANATGVYIGTVPFNVINGTAAAPSISFTSDIDTGIYRAAADQLGIAAGGAVRLTATVSGITVTGNTTSTGVFVTSVGTAALPSYTFTGDLDTGLYWVAANQLGISTGGAVRAVANASGMSVTGNVSATGTISATSDIRLKKDIENIPDALEKILKLNGVTFYFKEDDSYRNTGVIAQEVEEVLPEAVSENAEGIKSVAYGNMVGLLIESIKELKSEVDTLRDEISKLKGE